MSLLSTEVRASPRGARADSLHGSVLVRRGNMSANDRLSGYGGLAEHRSEADRDLDWIRSHSRGAKAGRAHLDFHACLATGARGPKCLDR